MRGDLLFREGYVALTQNATMKPQFGCSGKETRQLLFAFGWTYFTSVLLGPLKWNLVSITCVISFDHSFDVLKISRGEWMNGSIFSFARCCPSNAKSSDCSHDPRKQGITTPI